MSFTPADFESATWQRLKWHLQARLESHRQANDADKDLETTAKLRGRIAELKVLLALDEPAPAPVPDELGS